MSGLFPLSWPTFRRLPRVYAQRKVVCSALRVHVLFCLNIFPGTCAGRRGAAACLLRLTSRKKKDHEPGEIIFQRTDSGTFVAMTYSEDGVLQRVDMEPSQDDVTDVTPTLSADEDVLHPRAINIHAFDTRELRRQVSCAEQCGSWTKVGCAPSPRGGLEECPRATRTDIAASVCGPPQVADGAF